MSSTVKDLVIGSGLRFADRGSHPLKGVEDPWHLYALERPGAAAGPPRRLYAVER